MTLGIVCGFRAEQRIADRISPLTALAWRNPAVARGLIDRGATALISFGVAGALYPALQPGDLLTPDEIVLADGTRLTVSGDFHALLTGKFPTARRDALAVSATIVDSVQGKRALGAKTGAIATDMESEGVAMAATAAGIPFAVFRAVSDPADHALPPAALAGLNDAGDIDYAAVMLSVLAKPSQLPLLIRTGQYNATALRCLRDCADGLKEILK